MTTPTAVQASDALGLLRYNGLAAFCAHGLDFPESYYRKAGVSRRHRFDTLDLDKIADGDLIFVKTDLLDVFAKALPHIPCRVGLATAASATDPSPFRHLLDAPNLVSWAGAHMPLWTENPAWADKQLQIPIGFSEMERPHGDERALAAAAGGMAWEARPHRILVTAMADTADDRKNLSIDGAHFAAERLDYPRYLALLGQARFVVCPRGKGPDTFRFWETLITGGVPATLTGPLDPLYREFGGLILNDWSALAEAADACAADAEMRHRRNRAAWMRRAAPFFARPWRDRLHAHHARRMAASNPL